METCENCGVKKENLGCLNCNEIEYIEEQYISQDLQVPKTIEQESTKLRIERENQWQKNGARNV